MFQSIEQFGGAGGIGKFQLASQIEPLRDLLHVAIFEIRVKRFSNGESNQVANHRVCSSQFTFILEFEFAGDGGNGAVDIANARNDGTLGIAQCATLGIGDYVLHGGDREALAYTRSLIDALVFPGREGDLFHDLADELWHV